MDYKNKQTSTTPQRGYLSELLKTPLGTENEGKEDDSLPVAEEKTNLGWHVQTELHVPVISELVTPKTEKYLAPAERWLTYGDEPSLVFPLEAFKPKVQLAYSVEPGQLPRTIEIERRRREYYSHDIRLLLKDRGIRKIDLIPPDVLEQQLTHNQKYGVFSTSQFFPLEVFDNEEFDCRTPEEWLSLGMIEGLAHPVPAEAFIPTVENVTGYLYAHPEPDAESMYDWMKVAVTAYDPVQKLYDVLVLDTSGHRHKLPRIYIMFKAEDPINFANRIKDAIARRTMSEQIIKYEFYVDHMKHTGIVDVDVRTFWKMITMATRFKTTISNRESSILLKRGQEVITSYRRSKSDSWFRHVLQRLPDQFSFTQAPEYYEKPIPELGCIQTEMKDFEGTLKYWSWYHLFVVPESYQAVLRVHSGCQEVESMSLFTTHYGMHATLQEFEAAQTHATLNTIKTLKSRWVENIAHNICMSLRDVGKGWFNINEPIHSTYMISKRDRLMDTTRRTMQGALRILVETSTDTFTNMIEAPCLCTLDCPEDFVWGEDLINTQFRPSVPPIFRLTLNMDEEGVRYSTDPISFLTTLVTLYRTAVIYTHGIPQVESMVLINLKFPEQLLSSVGLLDDGIKGKQERIELAYSQAKIPLVAYGEEFYRYRELWKINVDDYIQHFKEGEHTCDEFREEISLQRRHRNNLEVTLPINIVIGPFLINIEPLKNLLVKKRHDMFIRLLDTFATQQRQLVTAILDEYDEVMWKLGEKPTSIEHIFDIRDWIETIPFTIRTMDENARKVVMEYDICDMFWYAISDDDFRNKWEVIGWPNKILNQTEVTLEFLEEEVERFRKIQLDDESALQTRIDQMTVQVTQLSREGDPEKINEMAVEIKRLWKNMKDAQEFGQVLNQRQKLFGHPITPFDSLNKLIKEFEPYQALWITAAEWQKWYEIWMENPLVNIDAESIEKTVGDMHRIMTRSIRIFSEIPAVQHVATIMKNEMEEFKPYIPLIVALRNPGMKQRHWDQIAEMTGVVIPFSPTLNFTKCLELGIAEFTDTVKSVSDTASKEHSIEDALSKMKADWEEFNLEITPYKNTGTYIMKLPEEISLMLDEHLVQTQQLSFNPFKGPYEEEIIEWEGKLRLTMEVLDEWAECQKQWIYLEPIFSSEDIKRQLPVESKKFSTMERHWRKIMDGANEQPRVMEYCPDQVILILLKECNRLLDHVQQGLDDYLETKRMVFPRFYFLSDEELLEILAQAKNPLAVQPHLRKCFENIYKLDFQEDMEIIAMNSGEGEKVALVPTMYPKGNVEDWLLLLEDTMRNTLRVTLGKALEEVGGVERKVWVLNWPGQVVIAGSQTYWTSKVEEGIRMNTLNQYMRAILKMLDDLRSLVKSPLQRVERQVLSALIVIEVHARDVTQKLLDERIKNVNDFEWISQLRYYWVEEELKVRAVNAEFQYGYEYLGNSGRLVITPLTDRCYLTLTGALHLKFGGAPAGPAGTGKTETTKDLAKALAIQCVVFNCSDQLDFMAMGKFFKGLASSGAWACFDEFNRIDIEVLSVVAQQITTIQKAQQARLDRFLFEGVEIVLKESCAVFITMNPGYAGRTELPDNLKALFRPVAMMVPNYTLIAEISLFSFGFSNARQLAGKITTTFKLSSEQLSTQDHYDFGMRAVKTVIAVAGNLKRENPNMDEQQIVLRAIRDVNVPKFLTDDLKLFQGIVSDLFPRMREQPVDYGALEKSIRETLLEMGLEDVNGYVMKVIQLYETTVVRHGLMLVGPTGSGKTKCYKALQTACTNLKGLPSPSGSPFQVVHAFVLNPKSITMGQLYGEFDLLTHEWTDGILPSLVRVGAAATDSDKRWYVFDGPVDAVWIENMNSVLDDNKKLCLTSGEIIKLQDSQTMMFEVADLAVASPATVSRCGMVYLEPAVLGLSPFINCWLASLPELAKPYETTLSMLIDDYLLPAIEILRNRLKEIVDSVNIGIIHSFFNMMNFRLRPISYTDGKPPPKEEFFKLINGLLEPWVVFSIIWSVGATCDHKGRLMFSEWMRQQMIEKKHKPLFPAPGLVYDYRLNDGGFSDPADNPSPPKWEHWLDHVEEYVITPDTQFSDIEVPTIDTVRNAAILEYVVTVESPCLYVGPTGTGKTVTVISKLSRGMPKKFLCEFINFSARTSANQTQDLIDSKLDKRKKGFFGPPLLKRQIFFIDDLNMPAQEVYGAQPPIELIRQFMDFRGWYDRKNVGEFRNLVDVIFVGAMGPPGGGRNPVTMRLLRHFHYVAVPELEEESKMRIFQTIMNSWLSRTESLGHLVTTTVTATISVYSTIVSELLPTPAKTHYTFNLRDLSKVFQGILMVHPEYVKDVNQLLRLWYHECCRVFQDRLVNDEDRKWFDNLLKNKIASNFKQVPADVLGKGSILFGDFMDSHSDERNYLEIPSTDELLRILTDYLTAYNELTTKPMSLVLFEDAMSHLCRIARITRQPLGNALLLGVGGSGRHSLTRLVSHIAEQDCREIELTKAFGITEWRDAIKNMMLTAVSCYQQLVFLFSDTQIKSELFLEDLNNILNSGDVPNIYAAEDLDTIANLMKGTVQSLGLPPTKANIHSVYTKAVRSKMHTVITMSPIGEIFRARLRQFPALVNCCTIDWFSPWPASALRSVALQFLSEHVQATRLNSIVEICQYMHQSVVDASERYFKELSRHNYVTPTSYLELLAAYISFASTHKGELEKRVDRLKSGLDKLLTTSEEVKALQAELKVMKPKLERATDEANEMIQKIAQDTKKAEDTKKLVEKEEEEAAKQAAQTQEIADDAQRDLDEAMPALNAAEASLKALNKNDISEVRSLKKPPMGVHLVMEAMCIIKEVKPAKLPGRMPGEKILDYWEPGRAMLADPGHFLSSLVNFDRESITQEVIDKLTPYVQNPQFQPAKIITVSKACTSLCMWVHAMYKYYFVNKVVAPKKEALKIANKELEIMEAALNAAKDKMRAILDGLRVLNELLQQTLAHKAELEENMELCLARMDRAVRLTGGLADERTRWTGNIQKFHHGITNIVGDVLICAGAVAYLTPFTDSYRRVLLRDWLNSLVKKEIPHTPDCSPVSILGEDIVIQQWQLYGLPRDALSTENAVLVTNSKRWPLFIDPQGQANRWIHGMEREHGLGVCKLADKDIIRTLESAIRFGKPVLIENVGEELDPALDVILLKQLYKQGGVDTIRLGEATVPYNHDFRLYMTTKLKNPHYTPETSVKVLLVNFMLVPSGLQDQLLSLVVMQERPDLEEVRSVIISSNAQMRSDLKDIEDKILHHLSTAVGNPVDDIDLINSLETSKQKSEEIKVKVKKAEETERDIEITRSLYIPVANRAKILYFCLADLSTIDPMYQYSLEWFIGIFSNSLVNTERSQEIQERIHVINEHFTFSLYSNVCQSLFEKHKMHFAFLLTIRIQMDKGIIDAHEWHHFLAGSSPEQKLENPAPNWISEKAWIEVVSLKSLPKFSPLIDDFTKQITEYKLLFDSSHPETFPLPEPWNKRLDDFQRLLVLKAVRPDKVTNAIQIYIAKYLGAAFVEPQTADLATVYKDSNCVTPIIFVLSTGADPAAELYKFSNKMKMAKRLFVISLGQGQGPRAEAMLEKALEIGHWLFFQNCHLAPSWMPRLERLLECIDIDKTHKEFRVWLTSKPSPDFPASILQNGNKLTIEPPRGIKANMLRAYLTQVTEFGEFFHSDHIKVPPFKWLLFALSLFHGVCLERRKFGPLGFNIAYEFTDGDLRICISQLHMFLLEYDKIPFKVLQYTAGQINYGGRVTDDWDRRCIMNTLDDYYNMQVVRAGYKFDSTGAYRQLSSDADLDKHLLYIRSFPLNDDPELFGLHQNADISYAQRETYSCLSTLLALQPKVVIDETMSEEEMQRIVATNILNEMPKLFDIPAVSQAYPVKYEESLNTVLVQEAIRYNRLLKIIDQTLKDLLKALKGLVVMSQDLENLSNSLFKNLVPVKWAGAAYPSLKPLGAWVIDLNARISFLNKWILFGIPPVFWISGFFFPQAFLTATLQNYARKYVVSIDSIDFAFQVLRAPPKERPADGCCVSGLFLEGARWNSGAMKLAESFPKELYTDMPVIWFLPEVNHKVASSGLYECPVYKTLTRAGTLSTTGHSTNYVVTIELPTDQMQKHWIKRGVALLCALDY